MILLHKIQLGVIYTFYMNIKQTNDLNVVLSVSRLDFLHLQ